MTGPDWRPHAQALADGLRDSGDVRSEVWHRALRDVPRHVLVPRAWVQGVDLGWTDVDTSTPDGLALVYSSTSLYTKLDPHGGVSSSTRPDLVARLLEELHVGQGDAVLEVGTGSGYTVALLAHGLGDTSVSSMDVDAELVDLARARLASLGLHPYLAVGDGAAGLAHRAPYDRLLATCAVPAIPTAWIDQVAPGGRVLASVMPALDAGSMVALRQEADALVGRFLRRRVTFMPMRSAAPAIDRTARSTTDGRSRTTALGGEPWRDHPLVWMWSALEVPGLGHGYVLDPDRRVPRALLITAGDGSWAEVDLAGRERRVVEGGPTPLWRVVEAHHEHWRTLGEPGWERLGLTATPRSQDLWLDTPDSPHRWTLARPSAG